MLTLFLFILNVFTVAWAEAPEVPQGMDYRIDAYGSYFESSTNYEAGGGSTRDLLNNGEFTDMTGGALYTQDINRAQRYYGGLTYSSTESYDGTFTRNNAAFNEILIGGQYWMNAFGSKIGPTGEFVYPLVRVDPDGDDTTLGEGAIKVRLGSWVTFGTETWVPFAFVAYEYRDEGRSHAIPYSVGLKWKGRPFYAQVEYRGYERLFAHSDSENRGNRDTYLQRVNGGSYRYYAMNSALSEVAGEIGWALGPITVYGGYAITVNGSSAAAGWTGMGGIAYSPSGYGDGPPVDEYERINSKDGTDRFTPHVDPFDELDPTKPPKPEPKRRRPKPRAAPAEREADVPPPAAAPGGKSAPGKPGRPKPKPRPKKTKTDKMLDEAEENLKNL